MASIQKIKVNEVKNYKDRLYEHMSRPEKEVIHQGETVEDWLARGNAIKKVGEKKPLKRDKNGRYLKKEVAAD